jgi:hypothetical protein
VIEPQKQETKALKHEKKPKDNNLDRSVIDLQPVPKNPFAKIDKYARQCPQNKQASIDSLSNYLQQEAKTDIEKARAIFTWITAHIDYDDNGYNTGLNGDYSAEGVLLNKKAICEGFSNLYLALGQHMGLEIEKVVGYAKGYGYKPGMKFKETNHAWNIIKIGGDWKVFDATWGQGYGVNINGKLKSTKEFNDYWFNIDPFETIFNHFPEDNKYAFVQPKPSLSSFEKFTNIDESLFEIGFNCREIYKMVVSDMSTTFPACFKLETYVKMRNAPTKEILQTNEIYNFEFFIPRGYSVAMIDADNNWTYFNKEKGIFKLAYTPKIAGELQISVNYEKGGESYDTVLIYNVSGTKALM